MKLNYTVEKTYKIYITIYNLHILSFFLCKLVTTSYISVHVNRCFFLFFPLIFVGFVSSLLSLYVVNTDFQTTYSLYV